VVGSGVAGEKTIEKHGPLRSYLDAAQLSINILYDFIQVV
jgi:hypothetical protein